MTDASSATAAADVFKIAPAALWNAALAIGVFAGSEDDARDGFIHLSTAEQVPGTLAKYFRNQPDLLLIGFDSAALGDALTSTLR